MKRSNLWLLVLGHAVTDTYSSFLPGLVVSLVARLGLSNTAVGALATLLSVTGSLSQLLYGYLADRARGGILIVIGPAVAAVCMSLLGGAGSLPMLVILLILGGSGVACFHPQAAVAAGSGHPRRRGTDLAFFVTGGTLGYALGPLLATAAVRTLGPERLWLASLPGLLMAVVLARTVAGRVGDAVMGRRGDAGEGDAETGLPSPTRRLTPSPPHPLAASPNPRVSPAPRLPKAILSLWAIVALRSAVSTGVVNFLPLYCARQGLSEMRGSLAVSFFLVAGAVSGLIGGPLSDRFGRRRVLVFSLALATPILLLLTRVPGGALLGVLVAGGFTLSLSAAINVAMAQEIAPEKQGIASAMVQGAAFGTGGLLTILAGYAADHTSIAFVYQGLAWLPLLTVPVALTLPETGAGTGKA